MHGTLATITIYPVKSTAGLALDRAMVVPRGLADDRRWMVVDADGRFITGRQVPALVRITAVPRAGGIVLCAPGHASVHVATPGAGAARRSVTVWKDTVDAASTDDVASAWLADVLGRPAQLVAMDEAAHRAVSRDFGEVDDEVSFADGFPVLLIGQASLDALNARLAQPVPMARFRPNLVIAGAPPHAEDTWRRLRIGAVDFDVAKPCTRCVFTTVDPQDGTFDPSGEPLETLKSYRRSPAGVTFGMNLIARGTGAVAVGDPVAVLA